MNMDGIHTSKLVGILKLVVLYLGMQAMMNSSGVNCIIAMSVVYSDLFDTNPRNRTAE